MREPSSVQADVAATRAPDSRSRRRLVGVAGVIIVLVFLSIAVTNGLRTFGIGIGIMPRGAAAGKTFALPGRCDAAVKTAWGPDPKKKALWAVTVGTNMMGYTPVFGGEVKYLLIGNDEVIPASLCRDEARHRLLVSGWLLAGAITASVATCVLLLRGRKRPGVQQATP
jgi:hypothetical protein